MSVNEVVEDLGSVGLPVFVLDKPEDFDNEALNDSMWMLFNHATLNRYCTTYCRQMKRCHADTTYEPRPACPALGKHKKQIAAALAKREGMPS